MKVKTFVSIVLAGLLATGIGYADDQNGSAVNDSPNSTMNNTNSSDPGEMGMSDSEIQQQQGSADTATDDED